MNQTGYFMFISQGFRDTDLHAMAALISLDPSEKSRKEYLKVIEGYLLNPEIHKHLMKSYNRIPLNDKETGINISIISALNSYIKSKFKPVNVLDENNQYNKLSEILSPVYKQLKEELTTRIQTDGDPVEIDNPTLCRSITKYMNESYSQTINLNRLQNIYINRWLSVVDFLTHDNKLSVPIMVFAKSTTIAKYALLYPTNRSRPYKYGSHNPHSTEPVYISNYTPCSINPARYTNLSFTHKMYVCRYFIDPGIPFFMMPPATYSDYFADMGTDDYATMNYYGESYTGSVDGVIAPHKARVMKIHKLKISRPNIYSTEIPKPMIDVTWFIIDLVIVEIMTNIIPDHLRQPIVAYKRALTTKSLEITPK